MKRCRESILLIVLLACCGCQDAERPPRRVKGIQDKLTEADLKRFLRVVNAIPEKRLPNLRVFRPLPNWRPNRTLPVNELIREEEKLLDRGWDRIALAERFHGNRHIMRALQREKLTAEQFAGLTLALGAAVSRTHLRSGQDLNVIIEAGNAVVGDLLRDKRQFAKLSRAAQFDVQRSAGWLSRQNRASHLHGVPPENIALVKANGDALHKALPKDFLRNPFDGIADLLAERGMPFEELKSSGRDADLTWSPEEAIIGRDAP